MFSTSNRTCSQKAKPAFPSFVSRLTYCVSLMTMSGIALTAPAVATLPQGGNDYVPAFFNLEVEFIAGANAGKIYNVPNIFDPNLIFSRGNPFIDSGMGIDDVSFLSLPLGFDVPSVVRDSDISVIPDGFNGNRGESLHLQVTSLDARSADNQFRLVAGQTLKNELPSLFQPTLGMIVDDPTQGIKGFFNLYGLIETPVENIIIGRGVFADPVLANITLLGDNAPFPFIFAPDPNTGIRFGVSASNPDGPAIARVRVTSPSPPLESVPEPNLILGLAGLSALLMINRSEQEISLSIEKNLVKSARSTDENE